MFDEIQFVLKRKGIESGLAIDLLDTYTNIIHMDLDPEVYHEHLNEASEIVNDKKDWPVFIFARHIMEKHQKTYLVSGDKHLNSSEVKKALDNRVMRSKEFLDMMNDSIN